jgi:uncharacterized protein (TIGR02246 family)
MRTFHGFLAVLGLAACGSGKSRPPEAPRGNDSVAIQPIVDSINGVFREALARKDVDALTNIYASDVLRIQDGDTSRGREGLREGIRKALPALKSIDFRPISFYASGDLAVEAAVYTQYWEPAGKPPFQVSGVYTEVFRRQRDGSWKTQIFTTTKKPQSPP